MPILLHKIFLNNLHCFYHYLFRKTIQTKIVQISVPLQHLNEEYLHIQYLQTRRYVYQNIFFPLNTYQVEDSLCESYARHTKNFILQELTKNCNSNNILIKLKSTQYVRIYIKQFNAHIHTWTNTYIYIRICSRKSLFYCRTALSLYFI